MTTSSILGMIQVATNQTQKENAINTQTAILEAAANDFLPVTMTGNAVTLTSLQWTRYGAYLASGGTGASVLTVPNTKRIVHVVNQTSYNLTVETNTSGSNVVIATGKAQALLCDGNNNIIALGAAG